MTDFDVKRLYTIATERDLAKLEIRQKRKEIRRLKKAHQIGLWSHLTTIDAQILYIILLGLATIFFLVWLAYRQR